MQEALELANPEKRERTALMLNPMPFWRVIFLRLLNNDKLQKLLQLLYLHHASENKEIPHGPPVFAGLGSVPCSEAFR